MRRPCLTRIRRPTDHHCYIRPTYGFLNSLGAKSRSKQICNYTGYHWSDAKNCWEINDSFITDVVRERLFAHLIRCRLICNTGRNFDMQMQSWWHAAPSKHLFFLKQIYWRYIFKSCSTPMCGFKMQYIGLLNYTFAQNLIVTRVQFSL